MFNKSSVNVKVNNVSKFRSGAPKDIIAEPNIDVSNNDLNCSKVRPLNNELVAAPFQHQNLNYKLFELFKISICRNKAKENDYHKSIKIVESLLEIKNMFQLNLAFSYLVNLILKTPKDKRMFSSRFDIDQFKQSEDILTGGGADVEGNDRLMQEYRLLFSRINSSLNSF